MLAWTPNPALYLSPEMVAELALGQDAPLDIAQKYGFTAAEFGQLQAQSWFAEAVFRKREELQANGITFIAKAGMMAEEMWSDIYQLSKSTDMRVEHRIEAAKQLADLAGMKPKAAAAQPHGPAFTINIQLPPNPQGPQAAVIDSHAVERPAAMVIELDQLPPKPAGYRVPDFKLTPDLIGAPVPQQVAK